jgi:hypothetical protein
VRFHATAFKHFTNGKCRAILSAIISFPSLDHAAAVTIHTFCISKKAAARSGDKYIIIESIALLKHRLKAGCVVQMNVDICISINFKNIILFTLLCQ